MKDILKEMRVKQYIKNALIFIPLFFNHSFTNSELLIKTILGFIAFSFTCSFVYIVNDILDVENDRKHPVKKDRPIASGAISIPKAKMIAVVLIIASCVILYISSATYITYLILVGYVALNALYSFKVKSMPVLDIVTLAAFYVIRLYFGAVISGIEVSDWLFLTIMSGSLMLGAAKRYKEKTRNGKNKTRKVLQAYDDTYLWSVVTISSALTMIFYSLWAITGNIEGKFGNTMIYSVPVLIVYVMYFLYSLRNSDEEDAVVMFIKNPMIVPMAMIMLTIYL